ncbi:MAG TPA: energy-coupled thiamine transporter ThiT [Bacillota bacterium]|nr:energy-coupled thiamine transporter ThiT [Bacillota bacterium]
MDARQKRLRMLIEIAILTALAIVLDNIPFLKFSLWPNGGSVSFAMVPVFIVAFRWGLGGGLISGLLFGLLKLVFGPTILHLYQAFIEYGFAFTVIGLAGIFSNTIKDALRNEQAGKAFTYITFGTLLGSGLRFLAHFYGGIVFWGEFAPEDQPVWLYSLVYNGSYMLPSFVICAVGIYLLFKAHPRLLLR